MTRNLLQFSNSSHYREITLSMTRNLLQFLNSSHYREITLSKMRNLLQIHDRSLSWPGTGTSIKSGRVKLVLWAQSFPFCEMMWSCKCFSHVKLQTFIRNVDLLNCYKCLFWTYRNRRIWIWRIFSNQKRFFA